MPNGINESRAVLQTAAADCAKLAEQEKARYGKMGELIDELEELQYAAETLLGRFLAVRDTMAEITAAGQAEGNVPDTVKGIREVVETHMAVTGPETQNAMDQVLDMQAYADGGQTLREATHAGAVAPTIENIARALAASTLRQLTIVVAESAAPVRATSFHAGKAATAIGSYASGIDR